MHDKINRQSIIAGLLFALATLGDWNVHTLTLLLFPGKQAYGIYLLHVAFILGMDAAFVSNRDTIQWPGLLFIFAFSLLSSCIASIGLKRSTLTVWLVP